MPIHSVDAATLKKWLDNKEAVLVDVREPAEFNAENIPGSLLMPLATVAKCKLPNCHGKKLVVHCKLGRRGVSACEKLLSEDPALEIYNLEGGISAWVQAGMPVGVSGGKGVLPISQQVQVAAGGGVVLGVVLGYVLSPWFYLLSGAIGAGLLFAGISGNCMLANLLGKMPWNKS